MLKKLEERRQVILERWAKVGHVFLTKAELKKVKPGSFPKHTKKSDRHDKRPLVLTRCPIAKQAFLDWYFSIYHAHKEACKRYRAGEFGVEFPPRTYRPPGVAIAVT